jgi:indolepyruvate ferredoxin oxidoreductase
MLPKLTPTTHATVCEWAEAAAGIKGFGPVKAGNVEKTRARWAEIAARL